MAIQLNHTIVAAHDKDAAAMFLTEILGLPAPLPLGPFAVVRVGDTLLDYHDADGEITSQHYAFLVNESEFDAIFARIRDRHLSYWADPGRHERDEINTWDGGRGVYFDDPSGHLLEIITRPYGSGVHQGDLISVAVGGGGRAVNLSSKQARLIFLTIIPIGWPTPID